MNHITPGYWWAIRKEKQDPEVLEELIVHVDPPDAIGRQAVTTWGDNREFELGDFVLAGDRCEVVRFLFPRCCPEADRGRAVDADSSGTRNRENGVRQ